MDLSAFVGTECNVYRQWTVYESVSRKVLRKKKLSCLHRTLIRQAIPTQIESKGPYCFFRRSTNVLLPARQDCNDYEWRLLAQIGMYILRCIDRECHVSSTATWKLESIDSIAHKIRDYINIVDSVDSVSACNFQLFEASLLSLRDIAILLPVISVCLRNFRTLSIQRLQVLRTNSFVTSVSPGLRPITSVFRWLYVPLLHSSLPLCWSSDR